MQQNGWLEYGTKGVCMERILFVVVSVVLTAFSANGVFAEKIYTIRDIRGRYVFSYQGEVSGSAAIAATGVLNADGKGNITDGVRMINVNGAPSTNTFSCTIVVEPNGTGSADCLADNPPPGFPTAESFNFVLHRNGRGFKFIATTAGIVVLGTGERQ
jgi:hypothetical protein